MGLLLVLLKMILLKIVILISLCSCSENKIFPKRNPGLRNVRVDPSLYNRAQLTTETPATNYYFTQHNRKKHLGAVYTRQVLIRFRSGLNSMEQQELVNRLGFVKAVGRPVGSGAAVFHALELVDGLHPAQVEQALLELQRSEAVAYAAPFFLVEKQLLGLSNELKVQLSSEVQLKEFEQLLQTENASIVKQLDEQTYLVQVDNGSKSNALELANFLSEQNGVAGAEPVFLAEVYRGFH